MPQTSSRRTLDVFLLGALGVALFASNSRFTFIDDEVSIISAAAAPLRDTLHAFWTGEGLHEHPPLYDIFLHFWLRLTGGSFGALRIPSILFYLLGLWFLSRAAEEIAGRRSARAVLWLGVLWPFGFHYGRLAAWYSFCFLIVAALTLAYVRLAERPGVGRWMFVMMCAAGLVCTNYLGWAILGCLAFDHVLRSRDSRVRAAVAALASGLILAIVYWPLWRAFFFELRNGPSFRHSPAATMLLGVFNLYNAFVSESVAPWIWVLGIPACLCVGIGLLLALRYSPPQSRRFLLYGLVLMVVMTAIGIISAKRMLPIAAWLLFPIGLTLGSLPRGRPRVLLSASLLGIFLIGWFGIFARQYYSAPRFVEPWAQVAAQAAERSRSGALIIGNNPSFFFYLTYALHPPGQPGGWDMLQTLNAPDAFNDDHWTESKVALTREVFFVRGAPGPLEEGPAWDAEKWLDLRCHVVSEERLLPDSASALKTRFLPEVGELAWRIRTREYTCPAGIETPVGNVSEP